MTALHHPRLSVGLIRRTLLRGLQWSLLAALCAGSLLFVSSDHTVTVSIDGIPRLLHTHASGVRAVLDGAGITVGEHDTVAPALSATVADHGSIAVRRGRLLTLTIGRSTRQVWVTATSVQEALDQLGLVANGEYVSVSRSRPIGLEGAALLVRLPQQVMLVHDGTARTMLTTAPTVASLLGASRVRLGRDDRLSVAAGAYPVQGMVIRVTRIHGRREIDDELIPQTTTRVADSSLYIGTTRVADPGRPGVIRFIYSLIYADSRLTHRTLVSRTQLASMRPEVIDYGTTPPPAPAPVSYSSGDGLDWQALANCESGGNPRAVSPGGNYRGLYQFAMSTWRGVGGVGDPIDASPAEQTYRAQILYSRVGRSAWPVCGQYL